MNRVASDITKPVDPIEDKTQSFETMPLISEGSDSSESSDHSEEVKLEECERELDLNEITDLLLRRFNEIKQTSFAYNSEKAVLEEQQRVSNREILKKNKAAEERQKIITVLNSQIEEKFKDLTELTSTIDRIKGNQDNNIKKISEIEQKIIKFKEAIKHRLNEKIDKSIRALETSVSTLLLNMDSNRNKSNMRSRDQVQNADDALEHKSTSPLRI